MDTVITIAVLAALVAYLRHSGLKSDARRYHHAVQVALSLGQQVPTAIRSVDEATFPQDREVYEEVA